MTVWYSDIQLETLGDPTKERSLNLKGTINLTDRFSGNVIEVMIFVWSRNNPQRKFQWVDLLKTSLSNQK